MNEQALLSADPKSEELHLGELEDSLGFLLRLAQVISYYHFFDRNIDTDLTPGEFSVLWVISLNPGSRQGNIAQVLKIQRAHMTKLVKRLISNGILTRKSSGRDRRTVLLSLTEQGQKTIAREQDQYLNFYARGTPNLTPNEHKKMINLLKKFIGIESET
jgi:DNA-binding MarR family transcriptional regulator